MRSVTSYDERATVHFKSSESMTEVPDRSVKLLLGASVYLGDEADWADYLRLYRQVYGKEGERIISEDGYFVLIQTDAYKNGCVLPRNVLLVEEFTKRWGWDLLDVKVWKRKQGDFFQPPFSLVHVFNIGESKAKRPSAKGNAAYFAGIWDYPQTAGGKLNAYPEGLCQLLVNTFTKPGDLICDPFAGTARLLATAARMERRAVGYEIDESLYDEVLTNLRPAGLY